MPAGRVDGRALGGELGIEVDVDRVAFLGVKVRVPPKSLVHAPAEELVDRLPDSLADDVPARHLESAHHADERRVGSGCVTTRVEPAPHGLDPEWIRAGEMAVEGVVDRLLDDAGMERGRVDLADADDAVVGLE